MAIRRAMRYRLSSAMLAPDRSPLDGFLVVRAQDHPLYVDGRGNDSFRIQSSRLEQFLDLSDGNRGRGRHNRIEVPCRLPVGQIAPAVAAIGLNQRKIGF